VPYPILIGRGVAGQLPALLRSHCPAHQYAIIADHKVAELYGAALLDSLISAGLSVRLFHFPSGEWNKTREQWAALTDQLLAAGFGRDSAVIAFGGGVSGDLGGFVAATYLRGVPCVQLPTTLLAMIDSSIGGKTGVDVPAGKNLVGAFHQPCLVVADINWLASLPRTQTASGVAEAIKHGVIRDAEYFATLEHAAPILAREPGPLEALVRRSVEIKSAVVAEDEREAGVRAILNFGHTVGHAVETLSGYELLHGEAVAIGMAAEARIAEALGIAGAGLRDIVVAMLERYGLPTAIPESLSADALVATMLGDKKSRAGKIRCVLPKVIGVTGQSSDGAWTVEVEEQVLRDCLEGDD